MKRLSFALPLLAVLLVLVAPGVARADSGGCLAHHPIYVEGTFETQYTQGCTGHDEPEIDPLSNLAGSGRDLTWTAVLPTNGSFGVDATGPDLLVRRDRHRPEERIRTGLRRAAVLSERAT